nr:hypothetical protein [Tanacetum cinerariifolium]
QWSWEVMVEVLGSGVSGGKKEKVRFSGWRETLCVAQ